MVPPLLLGLLPQRLRRLRRHNRGTGSCVHHHLPLLLLVLGHQCNALLRWLHALLSCVPRCCP